MTWTDSQRQTAIMKGKAGGKLEAHEERKLKEAAKQAGAVGRDAQEALQNARR